MEKRADYRSVYEAWCEDPYFDEATRAELRAIADDEKEIEDRFYRDLAFGTAGLRGVIGAGTNRMNIYVIRKTTQGLANYINEKNAGARGVAIAYDSRHMSPEFAKEAALTLCANGIRAYLFDALRPTPELSFAVRHLHCIAGLNITASHNPAEYNGYKVYWEDGAQITPPHDTGITAAVHAVTDWNDVKIMDEEAAAAAGLLTIIGKDVDDAYMEVLKKCVLHPEAIAQEGKNLSIVYTPLHGTGLVPVMRILDELGFPNVLAVPEQAAPDGAFPTLPYPNPEADDAFTLGLKYAKERGADLVLATDPDADRLGVRVRDNEGNYHVLTGNMSGSLLAEYEISQRKALGILPEDGVLVKTIVTTNLTDAVTAYYNVKQIEVLTGFKYIGGEMLKMEQTGKGTYLFGFEESYGCLIGTYARDKDAVAAVLALCEAAAFYKTQGRTLWDVMVEMYERYGYYRDGVTSIEMKGIEGLGKIASIMDSLRGAKPSEIGGYRVEKIRDYDKDEIVNMDDGSISPTGLPKSNVLYYELSDGAWVCVRPSGTEPKLKFYFGVRGTSAADAEEKEAALGKALREMIGV